MLEEKVCITKCSVQIVNWDKDFTIEKLVDILNKNGFTTIINIEIHTPGSEVK